MLFGLVLVPVVSSFTKAPDPGFVDETFSCYEEKVTVVKKKSLAE
jgi:SSS family solute:Na+ symporter